MEKFFLITQCLAPLLSFIKQKKGIEINEPRSLTLLEYIDDEKMWYFFLRM